MELKEYFTIIKRRLVLIIIVTLALTVTSAALSYFVIKPVYKSDISVIIGKTDSASSSQTKIDYNDVMLYQKMVKTYSILAKSRTVVEDVIKSLNLNMNVEQVQSMITVTPNADTEFLTISVKSKNAEEAMNITNQVAKSLRKVSMDIKKVDSIKIVDEAQLPTSPDSPKPLLNIAIAFFIGLMLSIGIVFILEYLDSTVKSQEDIEKLLELPVIGIIPYVNDKE